MKVGPLEEEILAILSHPEFTKDIVAALESDSPGDLSASALEKWRRTQFTEMVHRVAKDVQNHPRRVLLYQVIADDARMTDDDLVELFNFIYFYLVNQFKGQLAELLARPLLHKFHAALMEAGRAPSTVRIVPGHQIFGRRGSADVSGWYKSADALLIAAAGGAALPRRRVVCSPEAHITVVGAVEIKSYRANPRDMLEQLAHHISRMRFGARVAGVEIDPKVAGFLVPGRDGRMARVSLGARMAATRLARLAVRPSLPNRPARGLERYVAHAWMAELNPSAADLTEAGYRFADWFLGHAGAEVFGEPRPDGSAEPPERRPNPWPHLNLEEAGRMAFRQAMYSVSLRRLFHIRTRRWRPRLRRARSTFFWIYNSLCYGYANASGSRLLWPKEHPDLPRAHAGTAKPGQIVVTPGPVDSIGPYIKEARKAWSDGRLTQATRLLQAAIKENPSLAQSRKVRWLEGMIAFRKGDFVDAMVRFPGPEQGARDFWWTRDLAIGARLSARIGRGAEARKILANLEPLDQWPHRALPVEYHAVSALAWLTDRNEREATREVEAGMRVLEALREERRLHKERGWGEPSEVHAGTLKMAILDLAGVLTATGQAQRAADELTTLGDLDGWEFDYIARDPLLALVHADPKLRRQLSRWRSAELRQR